jgi:hypothetical protein
MRWVTRSAEIFFFVDDAVEFMEEKLPSGAVYK